jgi:hypothetical protein
VQGKVINWAEAGTLLGIAFLALAMTREEGFFIPERRDWLGWLRRLRPQVRRQREEEAGAEADRYVADLRTDRDQPLMTVRRDQLPSAVRTFRPPLVTRPAEGTEGQRPPWDTAANPRLGETAAPERERPRRRAPGDPPTIVIEVMRPAMDGDLGRYLETLPVYTDGDWSADLFVPRASLALGAPDHDGPPDDVGDHDPEERDLGPLQAGVDEAELEEEPGGEQGPGDREV